MYMLSKLVLPVFEYNSANTSNNPNIDIFAIIDTKVVNIFFRVKLKLDYKKDVIK